MHDYDKDILLKRPCQALLLGVYWCMFIGALGGTAKDVGFGEAVAGPVKEVGAAVIVEEDLSPFYPPDSDVVNNTRCI